MSLICKTMSMQEKLMSISMKGWAPRLLLKQTEVRTTRKWLTPTVPIPPLGNCEALSHTVHPGGQEPNYPVAFDYLAG